MGVYFSFSEGLTPPSLLLCRPPGLLAEGKGQRESKPYKLSQLSKPSKPSKPSQPYKPSKPYFPRGLRHHRYISVALRGFL